MTGPAERPDGADRGTTRAWPRRPSAVAVTVWCACSVILAGSWVLAERRPIPAWEESLFRAVNDLPDALAHAVWVPMQVGSFVGMTLFVASVWILTRRVRPALDVAVAGLVAWALSWTIKGIVDRPRPFALLDDIDERSTATGSGFVSSHTAVAFAAATVLAGALPRAWRPVPYAVAALVAFGRMLWGVHLPLDVMAGAALGVMSGSLVRWLAPPDRRPSPAGPAPAGPS